MDNPTAGQLTSDSDGGIKGKHPGKKDRLLAVAVQAVKRITISPLLFIDGNEQATWQT